MHYQEFINTVSRNQTHRVKALNIPESSVPAVIPTVFSCLLPEVIQIMEQHFDLLSEGKPILGIFGLQSVCFAIQSSLPVRKNRVVSFENIKNHLCAALYFLPLNSFDSASVVETKGNWKNYKSLVIDFTRGVVMDDNRYFHSIVSHRDAGKIYGVLDGKKLKEVWQNYRMIDQHIDLYKQAF